MVIVKTLFVDSCCENVMNTKNTTSKKIKEVEAGDYVILCKGGVTSGYYLRKVKRVTKTLVEIQEGRFRKSSGRIYGAGIWDIDCIYQVTDELLKRANETKKIDERRIKYKMVFNANSDVLDLLSDEDLDLVYQIILKSYK
jgi:hypothetical protein